MRGSGSMFRVVLSFFCILQGILVVGPYDVNSGRSRRAECNGMRDDRKYSNERLRDVHKKIRNSRAEAQRCREKENGCQMSEVGGQFNKTPFTQNSSKPFWVN